jgi:PAS domain-containing protein
VANQELSEVNDRLQALLAEQREKNSRESNSLGVVREVLDLIPNAIIGVDLTGMLAFVNADAEQLFGAVAMLLGRDADEVLPPDLLRIWQHGDGGFHVCLVKGRPYSVVCRVIGEAQLSRGKLLVLTPMAVPISTV